MKMWSVFESTLLGTKSKEVDVVEAEDDETALQVYIIQSGMTDYYFIDGVKLVERGKTTSKAYTVREIA